MQNINNSVNNDQKTNINKLKLVIKHANDIDSLIKKKKEILENRAKEAVGDFDVIFYQFKVIEKNMYDLDRDRGRSYMIMNNGQNYI